MKARIALALILLIGLPVLAHAQTSGPVARGRAIAQENCGRCHDLTRTGKSPNALAPPFRTLMTKYSVDQLEEALAEGIVVGHSEMPEFAFEPRDISDLLTFVRSLARK
jgi:cytochrome c